MSDGKSSKLRVTENWHGPECSTFKLLALARLISACIVSPALGSAGLCTRHRHACIDIDVHFDHKFHAQNPSTVQPVAGVLLTDFAWL